MKFVLGFDNAHRVLVLLTNQNSLLLPISLNLFSCCLISNHIWCLYFWTNHQELMKSVGSSHHSSLLLFVMKVMGSDTL
jgi:hypothetical protein